MGFYYLEKVLFVYVLVLLLFKLLLFVWIGVGSGVSRFCWFGRLS